MRKSFSAHAAQALFAVLGVLFFFLAAASLAASCRLDTSDPLHYLYEYTVYRWDPVWLNVLFIGAVAGMLYGLYPRLDRLPRRFLTALLFAFTAVFGAAWVLRVRAMPAFDSLSLYSAALAFARGNLSALSDANSYFRAYPFQLGYTALLEAAARLFREDAVLWAMQLFNVLCLLAAYAALLRLSAHLFEDSSVRVLLLLLLAGLVQPAFLCTFVYGTLPALALMLWALERLCAYLRDGRRAALCLSLVLIVPAVLLKYNCLIAAVAMAITLALSAAPSAAPSAARRRRALALAATAMLLLPLLAQGAVVALYEARAQTDLGAGMPQVAWLAMGLSQGDGRSAGWHTASWVDTFYASGCDAQATRRASLEGIRNSLWRFAQNPARAFAFLGDKLLSQWTEPTFESIWVSEVRAHARPIPPWVRAVYDGTPGRALTAFMNAFQSLIYLFGAVGLWRLRRRGTLLHLPLALTIFGGGLYHMLFEAKSMYILPYYVMLFPYAAYGLAETLLWARNKCARPPA
ncbi:hypothetical protein [Beduinella massiliensis]|uniref:hypothetical protein n=1 Tax=Beduinella massiliensis TaxID=1852363 RepID=UPI000C819538